MSAMPSALPTLDSPILFDMIPTAHSSKSRMGAACLLCKWQDRRSLSSCVQMKPDSLYFHDCGTFMFPTRTERVLTIETFIKTKIKPFSVRACLKANFHFYQIYISLCLLRSWSSKWKEALYLLVLSFAVGWTTFHIVSAVLIPTFA